MKKRTSRWRREIRTRAGGLAIAALFAGVLAQPIPASAEALPVPVGTNECPHMTDSITRLYSAYFLRAPEASGFDFWVDQFSSGTSGLQSMSDFFSISTEFRTLYDDLSNEEFVDLVYRNVLGRPAEPEGRAFWIGQLDSGRQSRGTVMINFSESPEFVARTGTAVPLAGYFNWYPEGTGFACGSGSIELALFPGDALIDMLAVHDASVSAQPAEYDVSGIFEEGAVRATGEIVPRGVIALNQYEARLLGDGIRIEGPPQLSFYLVAYPEGLSPFPSFTERGGWRVEDRQPTTNELAAP